MAALRLLFWLYLAFALLYPLLRILSLGVGEGFFRLLDEYHLRRYLWSLAYGLGSGALVVLLSLPLAFLFRFRFPLREVYLALATLPFVLPTPVVALGFLALAGPRGLLGVDLFGTPWLLFWGSVFYNLGLGLRVLLPLVQALSEGPYQAARTLGATPWRAFLRVGLPLLLPGLLGGGLLTFLYAFSAFGLPLLLGGAAYATLEVEVYTLLAYRLAFPEAAGLILLQALTLGLAVWLYTRLPVYPLAPPALQPARRPWLLSAGIGVLFLLLYAPLLALLRSFQPQALATAWASEDFTPLPLALANALRFALLSFPLVLFLGLAYALSARRAPWVEVMGLFPLLVSPVAVGLGYLLAYPSLRGSVFLLLSAYALLAYPLLARVLLPALKGLPQDLLAAARVLGATPWRAFFRAELPLLWPALRSGTALSLAAVLGEFGVSLVLWRPEWTTLTLAIYERLGRPGALPYQEALALALLLLVLSGLLFLLLDWGQGWGGALRSGHR